MTAGEQVIRPDFAKDAEVKELKQLFTILYDKIDAVQKKVMENSFIPSEGFEKIRCTSEALRNLETAAMYAVKALTV